MCSDRSGSVISNSGTDSTPQISALIVLPRSVFTDFVFLSAALQNPEHGGENILDYFGTRRAPARGGIT